MHNLRQLFFVVAALALSACTTIEKTINPPREERPSVFLPWGALRQDSSQTVAINPADLPPGVIMDDHTGDGQITVLALSGGGSYGPFGAGVLAGWTDTGERPEADVVTGVSAGSLLSTFAFLGSAFDDKTREVYSTITNNNIYERRDLIVVPFSSSMVKQSPLRALLERELTDDVLDRVARERRDRGRRLLVASTDLDNGRVVIFDLTSIAASGRSDRRKIYVDALMASSAIPGFFQPVLISPEPDSPDQRQQLHVDGSVSTSIFVPPFTDLNRSLPIKVYAIINSKMMEEPSADVLRVNALDITAASLQKVLRSVLQRSVYDMFLATTLAGGDFYLLGIPENITIDTPQYEFTPALTQALYTLGQTLGRNQSWRNEPPRFDSLTTQINIDDIRALTRR